MARILLVYPPFQREVLSGFQPLGLTSLAAYVLKNLPGATVKIIDYSVEPFSHDHLLRELREFTPDVVGIGMLTLNYPGGRLVCRLVREAAPDAVTVMGGVHATIRPEECLDYCDVVVRGEGELTFLELAEGNDFAGIRGISYRFDGEVVHNPARERIENLDRLPFPAHSLLHMDRYRYKGNVSWGIMGSRGCTYGCTFCSSPQMWNRVIRSRSATRIADEIEFLYKEIGIQNIVFFDDTLNIPQSRAVGICREIIRRDLHRHIVFECQLRANRQLVSLELFQAMREANFVSIDFGIESASARVLAIMGKSLMPAEAKQAVRLARRAGIRSVKGYFIVGNWGETLRDVWKTWWFVLSTSVQPAFSICTPFPGTEFYRRLKEHHYLSEKPDWASFNQTTPITRTDTMSKPIIFTIYLISIMLQLLVTIFRGGSPLHTFSRMVAYTVDKLKFSSRKATVRA